MPAAAAWLVASPANAVLALGGSLIVPVLQPLGAIALGMLLVARGVRPGVVLALLAGVVVAVFSPLMGRTLIQVVWDVAVLWLPVVGLATVWTTNRSTLLTLQVSVLIAIAGMLVFMLVVDVEAYWSAYVEHLDAVYLQAGLSSPLALLPSEIADSPSMMAAMLTPASTGLIWLFAVLAFMLGGGWYNRLPGDRPKFGRLRDADFGRVLASLYVIVLVVGFAASWSAAWQVGALLTTVFLVQGLVVAHWFYHEGYAPLAIVFLAYGLLLVAMQYAVVVLAVTGFMDALFGLRRRFVERKGSKT